MPKAMTQFTHGVVAQDENGVPLHVACGHTLYTPELGDVEQNYFHVDSFQRKPVFRCAGAYVSSMYRKCVGFVKMFTILFRKIKFKPLKRGMFKR